MQTNKWFISGVMLIVLGLTACSGGNSTTNPTQPPPNAAANLLALDDTLLMGVPSAATLSSDYQNPQDSTPDLEATTVYFTAQNAQGAGVFKAPILGGATGVVFVGAPFVAARGIVMSADGKQILVADPGAQDSGKTGQIFAMQTTGGSPIPVRGSAGTAPQYMAVVVESGRQVIYFTGKDPGTGQPAVMSLDSAGADAPTIVLKGAPLSNPDGIVVTTAGIIYVADRSTGSASDGRVFKIEGGIATPVMDQVRTGNPAGMALSSDESVLLISAVSADPPSAQVRVLELASLRTGIITRGISQNKGSGGLHASPGNKKIFSWVSAPRGPIYKVMSQ